MILAIRCAQSGIVSEYFKVMKERNERLGFFAKRFTVDYKMWVDEENEYFVLFKINIHLLGLVPLLIMAGGSIYLSTIFHATWLIILGVFFFLAAIVQTPPFWYYIIRLGLKKVGYKEKVRMVQYGSIMERLYDNARGNI